MAVDVDSFVVGCIKLRGYARALDLFEVADEQQHLKQIVLYTFSHFSYLFILVRTCSTEIIIQLILFKQQSKTKTATKSNKKTCSYFLS